MSETVRSFEAVLASIPKPEKEETTFTIALGDYFPGVKDVLTFHKMKASLLFGETLGQLVERIKFQKCQEDDAVILEMAFIIGCHKEPEAERPELLVPGYINIFAALSEAQKWQFVQEFKDKGAASFIDKMQQVISAKKNGSGKGTGLTGQNGNSSGSLLDTSNAIRPKRPSRSKTSRILRPTNS